MSGEAGMGREKRGKQTLRKKMMVVMLISAMSSILAVYGMTVFRKACRYIWNR